MMQASFRIAKDKSEADEVIIYNEPDTLSGSKRLSKSKDSDEGGR